MMRLSVCALVLAIASAGLLQDGRAQTLPPKGTDESLEVATWNIEWFGSMTNGPSNETNQLAYASTIIDRADIDLWAVQEIDNEESFADLIMSLYPDYTGYLGRASSNLKVGFIYKEEIIRPIQFSEAWLSQFEDDFAGRPPLVMLAEVEMPDTTVEINFVTLHMKCCGGQDDFEQRSDASTALKNRIDALHASDPFIILGDFNDELSGSISTGNPSPYDNFLEDEEAYRFTSQPLDENDEATWCGNTSCTSGSTLDHILITDELFDAYVEGSTDRYDELIDAVDNYTSTTSDHLPVFASFSFPTGTSAENHVASTFTLDSIHPNPATDRAAVRYSLEQSGRVRIELVDGLGRLRGTPIDAVQGAGSHNVAIDLAGVAAGVYFVRITSVGLHAAEPLIITP